MRTSSSTFESFGLRALLATLALTSGCRIEKPATVVPKSPTITSFTASARDVSKGGQVTLSWVVTDATRVEVRENSGGLLPVAEDALEGSVTTTVDRDSLFVLVARGPGGSDARALSVQVEEGSSSVSFQAIPPSIPGGQDSTLTWSAPRAEVVTLAAGTTAIDIGGQLASGAVVVKPSFDTTYTLTVDGRTSEVTVDVQPSVLSFEATPPSVLAGQSITLGWTAAGADRVVVSRAGVTLATITDAAQILSGSFTETAPALSPGSFLRYTVTAFEGTVSFARTLDVFVGSALEIRRFDVPAVAAAGASFSVRWETVGADAIELRVDGALIHRSAPAQAAVGQFAFTAPTRDFEIELRATDRRNGVVRRVTQVDTVGVPTAVTLTATPTSVTGGDEVTLSWNCPEARAIRIVDSDGLGVFSTSGVAASNGSLSVRPSSTTIYTATADNQLGSAPVTASVTVTVTAGQPVRLVQSPVTALAGQAVRIESAPAGVITGLSHSQVLTGTQADFLDISGTGTRVLESGGNVVSVTVPFSTLLWGAVQSGPLTISRAGWMAWGGPLVVNNFEVALPSTSTSAAPSIIAPYWDDLTLTANSAVFVQVVGNAPDQQLIVQWNRMQCGSTTNTEATFQARVQQSGRVSFHYRTMTLNSFPSFTIGTQNAARNQAVRVTTTPLTNTALYFFSPVTSADVRVAKGMVLGAFVAIGNTNTRVQLPVNVVTPQVDVGFSEFMFRPAAAVSAGQYLELFNSTSAPLDLTGWFINNPANGSSFSFPDGYLLPPNVFTVVGQTLAAENNDDAGVNVAWGTLFFEPDAGQLAFGTADASIGFTYTGGADGGRGASVELEPGSFMTTTGLGSISCLATRPFGAQVPPQLGTPGIAPTCFPYRATVIPAKFVDISDAGTPLLNSTTSIDGRTVPIVLASDAGVDPAPSGFGVRQPVVSMSIDGWMVWGSTTTTNFSNESTSIGSGQPTGALAIFWDDLEFAPNPMRPPEMYWKRFAANEDPQTPEQHWVFTWHRLSHWFSSGKGADDLSFQVKLFENGVIEYHYGAMVSGTTDNYGTGSSATIWLENPAGTVALVRSINQPLVQPNTAVRFTPIP